MKKTGKIVVSIVIVALILCVAVLIVLLLRNNNSVDTDTTDETAVTGVLDYATGVTVIDDSQAMQAIVDEALAKMGNIIVSYQGEAYSTDGINFTCYFANSDLNEYDMYIGLYEGETLEEDSTSQQLFLSGLMRPGECFESITLERALDPGTHACVLSMTQVDDDHTSIVGQTLLGVDLIVGTGEEDE